MRGAFRPSKLAAIGAASFFSFAAGLSGLSRAVHAADFAYVTNQGSETVSVVDLTLGKVSATVNVPGKPAGIALSPDKARAYVTAPDTHDIAVIDTAKNEVTTRIVVGGGPVGIAVHPKTGLVYAADWYTTRIAVIDPADGRIVKEIEVGHSPSGIAISRDGTTILSADRDSDAVSVIDAATNTAVTSIPVGKRPFGITLDDDGRRAYTANVGSDDITVIDVASRKVAGHVPVGRRPYAVGLTKTHGFSTDQYGGTITVFDLATLKPVKTIEACDHPEGIALDATRNTIYVACWFDNVLLTLDPQKLEVTGKIPVGDGPRAFGAFLK